MKKGNCAFIKRAISIFLCALFLFLSVSPACAAEGGVDFSLGCPDTAPAAAVYLKNLESGRVMSNKNANVALSPSATVKMMTGLLALERFGADLSEKISVSATSVIGVSGNILGLEAGEIYTAEQLLYALICGGYNDAACVLAFAVGGSVSSFVNLMNARALEWGMNSTVYANPTGIRSTATTTLSDVVILAQHALKNETYLAMSSAMRYEIEGDADSSAFSVTNRNALIYGREVKYRNVYCEGLCAGTDSDAGYCTVTVAKKNGLSYLCVVMGAYATSEDVYSYIVANRLISWALSSFGYKEVIDKDEFSYEVSVSLSDTVSSLRAVPKESVSAFLPLGMDASELEFFIRLHEPSAKAPIKKGDELGYLIVRCGDEEIARTLLVSDEDVASGKLLVTMQRLGELTRSRKFIIFAVTFLLIGSGATVAMLVISKRMKKRRFRYRV